MKITVCVTVLNEEKTIVSLLESLVKQTTLPDEIVIVDGGSSDNTVWEISKFKIRIFKKKKIKTKIILIKTKKTSIASARNISIKKSSGEIIAMTDAGCVPKKDWLENITQPLVAGFYGKDEKPVLVAGFYKMPYKNSFQETARVYLGVPSVLFDPNTFLPSARSVAFKKSVWMSVGGFNENLEKGGEDTEFFYKIVKKGCNILREKKAVVVWKELENINFAGFINKIYIYAKGDGQAGIWWHPKKQFSSHNVKISLIYLRYMIGVTFLVFSILNQIPVIYVILLLFSYYFWAVWKWKTIIHKWSSRLWLPILQTATDMAVMAGFLSGCISLIRFSNKHHT